MFTKNKAVFYAAAIVSSLCIVCLVAVLAINATDSRPKYLQYAEEYNGSPEAYKLIFESTDCKLLKEKFDLAYEANQSSQPGTIYFKRSLGFMSAADERMRDVGCYK